MANLAGTTRLASRILLPVPLDLAMKAIARVAVKLLNLCHRLYLSFVLF